MRVILISGIIVFTALAFLIQAGITGLPGHTAVLQEDIPNEYSHDYCPWGDCPHEEMNTGRASGMEDDTEGPDFGRITPHTIQIIKTLPFLKKDPAMTTCPG